MTSTPATAHCDGLLRCVVVIGAVLGASGVALAAMAAHAVDSASLATAATMLMVHAVAVIAIAAVAGHFANRRPLLYCAALIALSVTMFSGGVALSVLTSTTVPMLAPAGGTLLIVAWMATAISAGLARSQNNS